jgi:hypothetical protein
LVQSFGVVAPGTTLLSLTSSSFGALPVALLPGTSPLQDIIVGGDFTVSLVPNYTGTTYPLPDADATGDYTFGSLGIGLKVESGFPIIVFTSAVATDLVGVNVFVTNTSGTILLNPALTITVNIVTQAINSY